MIRSLPRRWRAIGATVLMLAVPASARPPEIAPYRWTNVKVGAGGYAPNIVFSPAERGLAYLRTDMGGAYRWDDREQRWLPLQDGNAVPSYMGIESIAPDPRSPDIVYMAAGMNAGQPAAIPGPGIGGGHGASRRCRSRWAVMRTAAGSASG
jgi:xyloglucan-specific exo-beta-1,4-glucanase